MLWSSRPIMCDVGAHLCHPWNILAMLCDPGGDFKAVWHRLGQASGHLGTLLDLCRAILEVLGAPWAILGCSSATFGLRGVVLEVTWSISKLSGAFSGASLAIFRASWAILGDLRAILELTFSILHPLRAVLGRGLGAQNGAPVEAKRSFSHLGGI